MEVPHIITEVIQTLRSLLKQGDWLVEVDLKGAYFSSVINWEHRKYLCFVLQLLPIQMLPIQPGLKCLSFNEDFKLLAVHVWELEMGLIVNMNDNLLMVNSNEMSWDSQGLPATLNTNKFLLEPAQSIEFLGFTVKTVMMGLSCTVEKLMNIWAESWKLLEAGKV